jgi:hypothetical protein
MTFVLQREGGSWKVIHEHWSSKESDDVDGDDQDDEGDGGFDNFDAPGGSASQDFRSNLTVAPHHGAAAAHPTAGSTL